MFDDFYGLTGRPFQLTPDPAFYFESLTHRKALSYLGYGLAQGEGFIVITGEVGAGKSTLVAHLVGTIDPQQISDLYSTRVANAIFEGLYQFDYLAVPARVVPNTAAAMPEIADGGRTWTIRIKPGIRSEERRVGKEWHDECRSRWAPHH